MKDLNTFAHGQNMSIYVMTADQPEFADTVRHFTQLGELQHPYPTPLPRS